MAVIITRANSFTRDVGDGTLDLDLVGTALTVALLTSTATVANLSAATLFGSTGISANELPTANGYTAGGILMTAVTWTLASSITTLDANDVSWTASGGSIVAKWAVLYANATLNGKVKPLVAYVDLDNTSAGTSVTTTTGNALNLVWNASGIISLG